MQLLRKTIRIMHLQPATARHNKVRPPSDFVVTTLILLLISRCAHISSHRMSSLVMRIMHSRTLDARDDNKVGPSNDFVDFWHSFAFTFDECTSQLPRDAFPGNANFALTDFGSARQQQSRTFVRLCRFLAQFCFDFRRVHIAAPTGCVSWK
ncbi:hypothetical protein V1478_016718 [Vespula squamosa]|uniref:Secreted protein n=1 Tax=Vespula squamosa TaxID=30214 RepID=A0ABD2A0M0_VESSQ